MKTYTIDIEDGSHPEPHEYKTAEILARESKVLFLKPTRIRDIPSPDIIWKNQKWEIKAPKKHKNLIHNNLRPAIKQSNNIIIDLRRIDCPVKTAITTIRNYTKKKEQIKKLIIINQHSKIIKIK